jgi:hypothetical protein
VLRIDELSVSLRRDAPEGVRFELRPTGVVTAAVQPVLPAFDGWVQGGALTVRVSGIAEESFAAALAVDGAAASAPTSVKVLADGAFSLELSVSLTTLAGRFGQSLALGLALGDRVLRLLRVTLQPLRGPGPAFASLDVLDVTDTLLFDAPPRRLFDLQNPEEGFWRGTGTFRLRVVAEWARALGGDPYGIEPRPANVSVGGTGVTEDATRRTGGTLSTTELSLDTGAIGDVPPEGRDVPLDVRVEHALGFGEHTCTLSWRAALPVRVRDPGSHLKAFQRLSAVGVDFGTSSTVAALYQRGYRALLRLGQESASRAAENPTAILVEDHERLWATMAAASSEARFPDLVRVVKGSHAARAAMVDAPTAVVTELKSLPERVVRLDEAPQLRDRERQRDFLLDEARVRALIRAYAYLVSRAINRPGQDVYLHYWLTHPAKLDERTRSLLEEELRAGLLLGIPQGIDTSLVTIGMRASEPEALAAEVCPELCALPALEAEVARLGELRFAVFDLGGGTLDLACGRFRPATPEEERELGSGAVIETMQVGGDDHLGGEVLGHELAWLAHQHPNHLPEMERLDVPMMRPETFPPDNLAKKPHLYKRSLAARQNRHRVERALSLEQVKEGPTHGPTPAPRLHAARLDGTEVELESFGGDLAPLGKSLSEHLEARIREGAKLLRTMLASAPWGGEGDWRAQGVVLVLAGNASRSKFVERALAEELGMPDLKVWRPGSSEPFSPVVLWETPPRVERGVTIASVTPKTAVALGALKIANREVHLVRKKQGFGWFVGDLRGFPPKFVALVAMGTPASTETSAAIDFGRWDAETPLRVAREYVPGKMTSSDPRLSFLPTGLPMGERGHLKVLVTAPDELLLMLEREGKDLLTSKVNLAQLGR